MKKLIALMLALCMVLSLAACTGTEQTPPANENNDDTKPVATEPATDPAPETDPVEPAMTYAEYDAAEMDAEVVVECYVQATQSWWFNSKVNHGVITVYAQDQDGAYFLYEMACEEEDAAKLVPGTKIRVTGYKGTWAGEIEIMEATFEFVEGADTFIAAPKDVTALLGTEELIKSQNQKVLFKGMTFKSLSYKDDEYDKDIYVTLEKDGAEYSFCVENYLTGPDTDVYKAVAALEAGAVIDIEGFLYWYEGVNTHITAIAVAE
ncbi:MAG: hypothetical protein IKU57_02460 [Oscillospiraceae bacterium]|nr:hypothetical protein [Oscillospiraceae bacterium]